MSKIGELYAKLGLDTTEWDRKIKTVGASATKLGKKMSMRLTAPIIGVGVAAVKVFADFEQSLTNAAAVAGVAEGDISGGFERMEALARQMGRETVFSAKEAGDAMYYMASAGWDVDKMEAALADTLALSIATQNELAFTTETVISTINMFGLAASDAGTVADVFANAITGSQATLDRLGASMTYIGPVANTLNWSLEETTAALGKLYDNGIPASTAGTALAQAMAKLAKPTKDSHAAMKRLGVTYDEINPQTNDLASIVEALEGKTLKLKDAIDLFGMRGQKAMLPLIKEGSAELRIFTDEMKESGTAADMQAQMQETFANQLKLLTSQLSEAAIMIGEILVPALRNLLDNHIRPAIQWFIDLSEGKKKLILTIAGVVAAMGPLLMVFGTMASKVTSLIKLNQALGGALGKVGIVGAAAFVGWKIGKAIGEIEIAGKSINEHIVGQLEKVIDSLDLIKSDAQLGAAHIQSLAKRTKMLAEASEEAGHEVTSIHEALDILNDRATKAERIGEKVADTLEDQATQAGAAAEATELFNSILDDNKDAQEGAEGAAKKWLEYLKSVGLVTLEDKSTKVDMLRGELEKLDRLYADGQVSMGDYLNLTAKIKREIEGLSTELTETATPAVRDMAGVWEQAVDDMAQGADEGFKKPVVQRFTETKDESVSLWSEMADGLKTKWATTIGEVISGATSLKDGLKGIWDAIKEQFFDMIGNMLAKFATDFVGGILKGASDAASGLLSSLGAALGGGGGAGGVSSIASGFSSVSSALAQTVNPIGMISGAVTAIASVAQLFKQQGPSSTDSWHFEQIWKNTKELRDYTFINIRQHFIDLKEYLSDILKPVIRIKNRAKEQVSLLGEISANTGAAVKKLADIGRAISDLARQVSKIGGMQHGGIQWTPTVKRLAEAEPELVTPLSRVPDLLAAAGGGGNTFVFAPKVYTLDAMDTERFMFGKGKDAFIKMVRKNIGGVTREIKTETEKF